MQGQAGVRFVTATELMRIYADAAMSRAFRRDDMLGFARAVQQEITFQRVDDYAVSAADVFSLLTSAVKAFGEHERWPSESNIARRMGPRAFTSPRPAGLYRRAFAGAHSSRPCGSGRFLPERRPNSGRSVDRIRKRVASRLPGHARIRGQRRSWLRAGRRLTSCASPDGSRPIVMSPTTRLPSGTG